MSARTLGPNAGFTLLEVLIAASLLGIMMLILMSSLRVGAESWDKGEQRMALASRLFIVENFLRYHIGSVLPVGGTVRNGRMEPDFRGGPDDLHYVAPLPEQIKAGGLYRFHLYLANHGEGKDLRIDIEPYTTSPEANAAPEPLDNLALLEKVKAFGVSYLPEIPPHLRLNLAVAQSPQWMDEWQDNVLPALIRINIEPEGEEPWPTLYIAPRTQMLR